MTDEPNTPVVTVDLVQEIEPGKGYLLGCTEPITPDMARRVLDELKGRFPESTFALLSHQLRLQREPAQSVPTPVAPPGENCGQAHPWMADVWCTVPKHPGDHHAAEGSDQYRTVVAWVGASDHDTAWGRATPPPAPALCGQAPPWTAQGTPARTRRCALPAEHNLEPNSLHQDSAGNRWSR